MAAAAKKKTAKTPADKRRLAELAKIHIAKAQMGLDEATYREMLKNIGGESSAADLDWSGRRAVLDHMAARGFAAKVKGRPKNMARPTSRASQLEKIEALLTVGRKPWAYADGIAKRICKVDKVAWVESDKLFKIITALRMQAKREGWDLSGERPW